jgi:hypothetical protein
MKVQRDSKNWNWSFSRVSAHSRSDSIFAWTEGRNKFCWKFRVSQTIHQKFNPMTKNSNQNLRVTPKIFETREIRLTKIQIRKTCKFSFFVLISAKKLAIILFVENWKWTRSWPLLIFFNQISVLFARVLFLGDFRWICWAVFSIANKMELWEQEVDEIWSGPWRGRERRDSFTGPGLKKGARRSWKQKKNRIINKIFSFRS